MRGASQAAEPSHAIDLTAAVWLVSRSHRRGPRAVASPAGGLYTPASSARLLVTTSSHPPGPERAARSLRLWWLGRGGTHSLPSRARPAAWPSPPPSSFLAQRLPSHHVRSICQRKSCSSLSRPSARACGRPGAEGGRCRYRYHIHWATWTSYWTDIGIGPAQRQPDSPIAK